MSEWVERSDSGGGRMYNSVGVLDLVGENRLDP